MNGRAIVHMDLDCFFVSCERLRDPKLRGKPVVVGGYNDRSVVSSASYEARLMGVRAGMPIGQALRLCPDLLIARGSMGFYEEKSLEISQMLAEHAPLFEKPSIDEFFIDVSGMDRFHNCYRWTHELRLRIMRETGLPITFGLSTNKSVAKIATGEAKPCGELQVAPALVRSFLAPLPVDKMPGLGLRTAAVLRQRGILTLGQLAARPCEELDTLFGKNGVALWERANGLDERPVIPFWDRKSASKEHTFAQDTRDVRFLEQMLTAISEQLGYILRKENKLATCISIRLRYSDFSTIGHERRVPPTASDHVIAAHGRQLLEETYDTTRAVRLIGLGTSGLVRGAPQLSFLEDSPRLHALYAAMDQIKIRHGSGRVMRAAGFDLESHPAEYIKTPIYIEQKPRKNQMWDKVGRGK